MTRRQGIALASKWLIEAGSAWALLALLVFCVDPGRLSRPVALLLLVGPLCGALASPALLVAMWRDPSDLWRYRWWSYVGAGIISTMFVLRALHLLTTPRLVGACLLIAGSLLLHWRIRRIGAAPVLTQRKAEPKPVVTPAHQTTASAAPVRPQLVQRIGRGTR